VTVRHGLALVQSPEHDAASLIARVAQGDTNALARLYDDTAARVHGLVLRVLGDTAAAEEVTADVFVQVWRQAAAFDPARGAALGWLLLIARSRALDRLRAGSAERARAEPLEAAMAVPASDPGPPDEVEVAERRRSVVRALTRLPPEQRQAVELAYYKGMSHAQIADATGQPLGTVKSRIRAAMSRLRDELTAVHGATS
jgi:RNA polymerase sigma-70 factor (ECF subfamily)